MSDTYQCLSKCPLSRHVIFQLKSWNQLFWPQSLLFQSSHNCTICANWWRFQIFEEQSTYMSDCQSYFEKRNLGCVMEVWLSCYRTWFCCQLLVKPGNKTARPRPNPYLQCNECITQIYFLCPTCPKTQIIELEHSEIDKHWEEIAENLILEHLLYTISIATNNRTPQPQQCPRSMSVFQTCLTFTMQFYNGLHGNVWQMSDVSQLHFADTVTWESFQLCSLFAC